MKSTTFKYWYIGIIFAFILAYLSHKLFRKESLFQNGKMAYAYVYEVNDAGIKAANIVIYYSFFVEQREHSGGMDSNLDYAVKSEIMNRYVPVIYDTLNPNNNILLISEKNWEKLNLPFPDSLSWLKKYYPL